MSDLTPGSPEWLRVVSASKVPAILGVSPWESPFSMWHHMRGEGVRAEGSQPQKRGQFLENGVLDWFFAEHPELTQTARQVRFDLDDWAIATVDATATSDDGLTIVECKTTTSMDEWGEPGTDVIPAHYAAQVFFQLALSGARGAWVTVLGPFMRREDYYVPSNPEIQADLIERARAFYESLSLETPPPLDDHVATVEVLRQMHPDIERGETAEIPALLAADWLEAKAAIEDAQAAERAARAQILDTAKRAQFITTPDGRRVARRQAGKYGVNLIATAKHSDLIGD